MLTKKLNSYDLEKIEENAVYNGEAVAIDKEDFDALIANCKENLKYPRLG